MNSQSDMLQLLVPYLPSLIVHIVGLIVAIMMMSTYRKPSMLVLIAMIVGLIATLQWPVFNAMLERNRLLSVDAYWQVLRWSGILLHVTETVLLLLAAFAGRNRDAHAGRAFEVTPYMQGQHRGGPPTPPPQRPML